MTIKLWVIEESSDGNCIAIGQFEEIIFVHERPTVIVRKEY